MITIIEENRILIITEDELDNSMKYSKNIDILKIEIDKKAIQELNRRFKEKYSYIFFTKECIYGKELINFVPSYFMDNLKNKLFINELIVNPLIMENILNYNNVIEIAIILKYILQNEIKQEDFNFSQEMDKIKKLYRCTNNDIYHCKDAVYHAVEKNYVLNNLAKIEYDSSKDEIVKKVLFKAIDNIIYNLKNTNELVFKEFISVII